VKIFVTGDRGQLGRTLRAHAEKQGHEISGGDLPDWQMLNPGAVLDSLSAFGPDIVIHAAALTQVDYCAEHPDEAVQVNGVGTYNVALACEKLNALLVAISSNEVFDGAATSPYQEYDSRRPVNPYGYSKYVAEQVVERFTRRYMIVRTSWLYATGGVNFIHKIVKKARDGEAISVVTDEISSPTHVDDLAAALLSLAMTDRPGLYHLTNAGHCSRFEFAQEIVRLAGYESDITPMKLADFKRASSPPPFAPLANVFAAAAGVEMRPWRDALADFMAQHMTTEAG
jgi:dTDP-4-dehydrorhamnose reductase